MKGIVAFLFGKENLLDHLGIFCKLYGIPLKVFDPTLLQIAKKWYKDLPLQYCDFAPDDLNPSSYPWILTSTLSSIEPLKEAQRQLFGKTSRFAYLPHGISAKTRDWKKEVMPQIDLFLFPGNALKELYDECGFSAFYKNCAFTGNFRHFYFEKHLKHYETMIKKHLPLNKKPSLFLLPSHSSQSEASFFFDLNIDLLQGLQSKYNVVVKPHPLLEEERPGFFWQLKELCKETEILFLDKVPLVLPYIDKNTCLITDTSSVIFDGLCKGASLGMLRKNKKCDRYDLSDKAKQIESLNCFLEEDFIIEPFPLHFCQEIESWLYSSLIEKKELEKVFQNLLQTI